MQVRTNRSFIFDNTKPPGFLGFIVIPITALGYTCQLACSPTTYADFEPKRPENHIVPSIGQGIPNN